MRRKIRIRVRTKYIVGSGFATLLGTYKLILIDRARKRWSIGLCSVCITILYSLHVYSSLFSYSVFRSQASGSNFRAACSTSCLCPVCVCRAADIPDIAENLAQVYNKSHSTPSTVLCSPTQFYIQVHHCLPHIGNSFHADIMSTNMCQIISTTSFYYRNIQGTLCFFVSGHEQSFLIFFYFHPSTDRLQGRLASNRVVMRLISKIPTS